ncbi:hypothetical protein CDL15_Pgr007562 [Punica granatum]|uniref:Uncharacterized protein n=1 Tax=Punica granatum TaxID=22663 RepID=A0A218X9E5_PUNGR|nr:hypothetical protein CDL15_Pgr007562 [Punica granatum]
MTCDCWPSWCRCCYGGSGSRNKSKKGLHSSVFYPKKKKMMGKNYLRKKGSRPVFDLEEIEEGFEGYDELEKSSLMSLKAL